MNNDILSSLIILTSSPELASQFIPDNWASIITYGGVAVAVILAITVFNQVQLRQITTLVKTLKNKKP